MEFAEVLLNATAICNLLGVAEPDRSDFSKYAKEMGHLALQTSKAQRAAMPWLMEWAKRLRALHDDFTELVRRDPMLLYSPKNPSALEFHQSRAYIRYFRAGNRSSKTTSGYAEDYWCVTGWHPYRPMRPGQASVVIIAGLPFVDYEPKVFERKLFSGEDGNILSPMFPENGKWFNRYDKKDHVLTLGCHECANKGSAQSCPGHHSKPTLALVSSEKGVGVIEAFTARVMHIDEHVPEEFLGASKMRVGDQKGYIIVTGTPLHGPEAWEKKQLADMAERPQAQNRFDPTDPKSIPYCSLHQCTKFDGGIVDHATIRAEMQGMDEFEIESRIYGRPAALAKRPVFDRKILYAMREKCLEPERGFLTVPGTLQEVTETTPIEFKLEERGALRVWEKPKAGEQYVIGVDTAAGLVDGDASCASVIKIGLENGRLSLKMVAQLHGWMGLYDYADGVFKLAVWYNSALAVVELTGGLGRGVIERLKGGKSGEGLCYWNIFRDVQKGEYAQYSQDMRFGLDTSAQSKPSMIGALQQLIKDGNFSTPCRDTIGELVAYAQETTDMGNTRFRGAGGTHDDRVMSLVLGAYVAISFPVYDFGADVVEAAQALEAKKVGTKAGDDAW
jgi:hypothetical protein